MKRDNIEFLIAWLDALRRDDREALRAGVDPDALWQGLREKWACHGAEEIIDTFAGRRDRNEDLEAIELIASEHHAILHASGGEVRAVEEIPLPDGIYNVFAIEDGRITRIDDFAERAAAYGRAGLAPG